MTLSEVITAYRNEKSISQREFAVKCGVSNGYISMLEKNSNPRTGEPIVPSLSNLNRIAHGMGITTAQLIELADDIPVNINNVNNGNFSSEVPIFSPEVLEVANKYECLTSENRKAAERMINALYEMQNKEGQK